MAEVNVKNNQQNAQSNERGLQTRGSERGLSRRRGWDPFSFSLMPADYFSSDPFSFMRRIQQEMDRSFNRFFSESDGTWNPAIEVAERDGKLQVHAELPGLKPEDVKVEVTDDALIIQGERKSEHEKKEGGVYRSERRYGQFYRAIPRVRPKQRAIAVGRPTVSLVEKDAQGRPQPPVTITGNNITNNKPRDLLYDGSGSGNTISGNLCGISTPPGIC